MRYCIILAYDGTNYHGWQFQPNSITVQQCIEQALSTVLRGHVAITGAGRTDTGVHARMMACHFDWSEPLDCNMLTFKLNSLLPADISVSLVKGVADDWHARFSAIARTYHYYICTSKNIFLRNYSLRLYFDLDLQEMNRAAQLLISHSDFGCFCKSHSDNHTNICHITQALWIRQDDGVIVFSITANRFLRNMVRAIVGTMIEIGKGRISIDDFRTILESGDRREAGESVPARGLFLERIEYPD